MILVSVHFSSVTQSCPTLCDPLNCSTPGLPVHHRLLEFTQTHIHWVGDAIQPSHPLSSPFSSCPQSLPASESFPKRIQIHNNNKKWVSFLSWHPQRDIINKLLHKSYKYICMYIFMSIYFLAQICTCILLFPLSLRACSISAYKSTSFSQLCRIHCMDVS